MATETKIKDWRKADEVPFTSTVIMNSFAEAGIT